MSDYQQFLEEKNQIDTLLANGFSIQYITENLSGAFLEFKMEALDGSSVTETVHILTAEGRKYFSVKYIEQQAALQ